MLASIFLKLKSNNLKIEIFNNKTPTTSSVEHEHKTPAVTVRGLYGHRPCFYYCNKKDKWALL